MLIDAKKDKIGGLGFGSSSVKYINFKKCLLEWGIMEVREKCGFSHDFAKLKKNDNHEHM
jgi:hypothetical protein